jgi:hypothetical protein
MVSIRIPGFSPPSESILSALSQLAEIDDAKRDALKATVADLEFPFSKRDIRKKAEAFCKQVGDLDNDTCYGVIDVFTDLMGAPQDFAEDILKEWFSGATKKVDSVLSLVKETRDSPVLASKRDIAKFKQLAIPEIGKVEHLCTVRARFEKQFRYSEGKIEDYDPRILDYHPMLILSLSASGDSERQFRFQFDQSSLDKLITELIAAQKELRLLAEKGSRFEK